MRVGAGAVRPAARLYTSDAAVEAIGLGLMDRTLPKAAWTHEGHFAATVWLLICRPEIDPSDSLPGLIRAYNVAAGGENTDTAGYHETITQASIRGARAFVGALPTGLTLAMSVNRLLRSEFGDPDWLLAHWSRSRLFSVQARRAWCDPDLQKLPF